MSCFTGSVHHVRNRGFSIVRFVLQHLLGERPIEELDEGPKAERTDQGAKAHKATQQPAPPPLTICALPAEK